MSLYLPAGSLESTVFSVPDVKETDFLSSLVFKPVPPDTASTPERSRSSRDSTVSRAPASSELPPPVMSSLLISAVIGASNIVVSPVTLPSLSTVNSTFSLALVKPRGAVFSSRVYSPSGSLERVEDVSPEINVILLSVLESSVPSPLSVTSLRV